MFMLDREFGGRGAPAVVGFAAGAVPPAGE
jgi:hypothetical protein